MFNSNNSLLYRRMVKAFLSFAILAFTFILAGSGWTDEYPFQPVGLWRYCRFERNRGPWENIHNVGDQNQDGWTDFIVRMYVPEFRGQAYFVFFGGPGADTIPDRTYRPIGIPCGDVNGDGIIDFFTNVHEDGSDGYGIKFGGCDPDTVCDVIIWNWQEGQNIEYRPVGDVSGDGLGDFVVKQNYRNDSMEVGVTDLKILLGGGDFDTYADWRVATDSTGERGNRFTPDWPLFGDFNGDGNNDIIETGYQPTTFRCVHNFLTATPETTNFMEDCPGETFEPIIKSVVPDINGDGCDDLFIYWGNTWDYDWILRFYLGGRPPDTEPDFTFDNLLGGLREAHNIGDVNGDGWDDLSMSMSAHEGAYWSYILLGGPDLFNDEPEALIVSPFEGVIYDNGLGASVIGIDDFDGNGTNDMLVLSQPDLSRMQAVLVMSLDAQFAEVKEFPKSKPLPTGMLLNPAWPNPFNSTTEIGFTLPHSGYASVRVLDLVGREVAKLAERGFTAGSHSLRWKADGKPSGVYLVRLEAGEKTMARPVMLVR